MRPQPGPLALPNPGSRGRLGPLDGIRRPDVTRGALAPPQTGADLLTHPHPGPLPLRWEREFAVG